MPTVLGADRGQHALVLGTATLGAVAAAASCWIHRNNNTSGKRSLTTDVVDKALLASSRGPVLNLYKSWRWKYGWYQKLAQRLAVKTYTFGKGGHVLRLRVPTAYSLVQTSPELYEPDVVPWIKSLEPGSVMWDIGANIGCYAIAAGALGLNVHAFEPSAGNFYELNCNIALNGLGRSVSAYCVALSDKVGMETLYMQEVQAGNVWNNVGEATSFGKGLEGDEMVRQGVYCSTVDHLVFECNIPAPKYLKIDVDGIELQILQGAVRTLNSGTVEMLSLEMVKRTQAHHKDMEAILRNAGFRAFVGGTGRDVIWLHRRVASLPTDGFEPLESVSELTVLW